MPKIDPITGCQVMTMGEFWQAEAEREGKTPGELQDEFYQMIDEDNRNVENDMREDALNLLRSPSFDDDKLEIVGECSLAVTKIVEILDCESNQSFRESGGMLRAKVLLATGECVIAKWTSWSSPGSFYEPPDGEEYVIVEEVCA